MAVSAVDLSEHMVKAARESLGETWNNFRQFIIPELQKIAYQISVIEQMDYPQDVARQLLELQRRAALINIVSFTEMIMSEVEKFVNAALKAVAQAVNTAVGFVLI